MTFAFNNLIIISGYRLFYSPIRRKVMCTAEVPEIKVKDLIDAVRQTDIPEAPALLEWLERSYNHAARNFYGNRLTPERVRLITDDLSVLISSLVARSWIQGEYEWCREVLWRGHRFLDEVRQKAVGLRADPDVVGF